MVLTRAEMRWKFPLAPGAGMPQVRAARPVDGGDSQRRPAFGTEGRRRAETGSLPQIT